VESGDLGVKIRDIINEETRVRDPYDRWDYEKDPETGEYTGRTTQDRGPGMLSRVLQKHSSGVPSFMPTDEYQPQDKPMSRTSVPQGKRLVVTTKDQRLYYKYPANPQDADKSGRWTDADNRSIVSGTSIAALEKLAKQNGKFEDLAQQKTAAEPAAGQQEQPPQSAVPTTRRPGAEPATTEPIPVEPDEPISLVDQPMADNERIAVDTPAGTFYKYADGNWYQIPTTGTPVRAKYDDYAILDDYADREGYVEKIPPTPKKRGRK
jgi:hypothetical protein